MDKNKYYGYISGRFELKQSSKGWFRLINPFTAFKDKSMALNFDLDVVKCFRTGYLSDVKTFISTLEGTENYEEVLERTESKEIRYYTKTIFTTDLPKNYKSLYSESFLQTKAIKYLTKRGFDINNLALKGIGFCDDGLYFGRIIIPYYEDGDLVFFTARSFVEQEPRYLNAINSTKTLSEVIYNSEVLNMYEEVYLHEGIFDALTVGDNAISFGGNKLTNQQLSIINNSSCKIIKIIPDKAWYKRGLIHAMKIKKECYITDYFEYSEEVDLNKKGSIEGLEFTKVTYELISNFFKNNK
jgi:DNA primase